MVCLYLTYIMFVCVENLWFYCKTLLWAVIKYNKSSLSSVELTSLTWTWVYVCDAFAEMVHLEQTSPSHRSASRESDDSGETTLLQVYANIQSLGSSSVSQLDGKGLFEAVESVLEKYKMLSSTGLNGFCIGRYSLSGKRATMKWLSVKMQASWQ